MPAGGGAEGANRGWPRGGGRRAAPHRDPRPALPARGTTGGRQERSLLRRSGARRAARAGLAGSRRWPGLAGGVPGPRERARAGRREDPESARLRKPQAPGSGSESQRERRGGGGERERERDRGGQRQREGKRDRKRQRGERGRETETLRPPGAAARSPGGAPRRTDARRGEKASPEGPSGRRDPELPDRADGGRKAPPPPPPLPAARPSPRVRRRRKKMAPGVTRATSGGS